MIEFKNVSKHFGPTQVLHNIDLNIAQGEVVVIIGPSGSGKSTLLRCINKLEEITSGDLIVDGLKVNDPKVDERLIRQEAGMVFQQFYLFPHLTALENVMFGPLRVRGANKEEAEKLAKEDYVHHVSGNTVYFKFLFDKNHPSCRPWTISVADGKKVTVTEGKWDRSDASRYVVFPDGTIYLFALHGNQPVLLNQFGEDKVNLPKMDNVKVTIASRNAFRVDDRALAQVAGQSRELFRKMNLPAPRTFITPGGWGLYPSVEQVSRVYGKQFGYTAGDVFNPNWSSTYSGRPFHRFSMSPYWNSLENLDVEKEKKAFADLLAKNTVIPVISHMWLHNLNNDFDKLLQRYDEFLAWVKEEKIPVRNMAEWADVLYDGKSDPAWNIFPSLACDRNKDGRPDGYDVIGKDTTLKNGEQSGKGSLFYISSLTGFTPGKNTFSLEGKTLNGKKAKFVLVFHFCDENSKKARKDVVISIPFQSGEFQKYERSVEVPAWVVGSHVSCLIDGEGAVRNLSLRVKPE